LCIRNSLSLIMARSTSVPAAAAVASSSARCRPVAAESRCPLGARRCLHAALAIVLLSSACRVSTAQGTWSTAQLSVARRSFAATSVGNVAIFAGGDLCNFSFALLMYCFSVTGWSCCAWTMFIWGNLFVALLCLRCRRVPSDEGLA
jgi:hypothetical protein